MGDRYIDNAPTDRPTHHHIDDKENLLRALRTETRRNSYPIVLLLLHLSLLSFQHLPSGSNSRSDSSRWLSFLLLSIHFGKEGLWFRPVFFFFIISIGAGFIFITRLLGVIDGGTRGCVRWRWGVAVIDDKTYFKKCLFLYAESFAVQGDMIVSEGEM